MANQHTKEREDTEQQEGLRKDGQPDKRHENHSGNQGHNASANHNDEHLRKDGQPDKRFEKQDDQSSNANQKEGTHKDGQPDQRHNNSGNQGNTQSSHKNDDTTDHRHEAHGQGSVGKGGTDKKGHPLTADGHPDQRVKD